MPSQTKLKAESRIGNGATGAAPDRAMRLGAAEGRETPPAVSQPLPSTEQPAYRDLLHFFNESPDLLCIADFDGRFKLLNPSWQATLGWPIEELTARPFLDFVHPDDRPATLAEMAGLAGGTPTIYFENRYYCKDGSWRWLQWTARPVASEGEIYAVARDITGHKRLEDEILKALNEAHEQVLRDLHDGIRARLDTIADSNAVRARALILAAVPATHRGRQPGPARGGSEMPEKGRVFLVDEDSLARRGLASMIETETDLVVCGQAASRKAALSAIASSKPALVITSLLSGGTQGLEMIKDIRKQFSFASVLVVSARLEDDFSDRLLRAGAAGCLRKEQSGAEILAGIRRVLGGDLLTSEATDKRLARKYVSGGKAGNGPGTGVLSDRESEVLTLIGSGLGNRQIAERLGLSVKTIETYREHLKVKLNLSSGAELVRFAITQSGKGRSGE